MISTQYIKLNMTPSGALPVLYCSQYDVGRPLGLVVHNGSEPVDLDTYTVTIEATRTDGTPITAAVTTDDNIGVFVTTAEMTNKEDKYFAKLALFDTNSRRVASLAFVIVITPATMDENAEPIQEDRSLYQQYTAAVQVLIAEIREDIADLQSQWHDTVADMKADTNLKPGMYARTGGYYAVNDDGGAMYRIESTAPEIYHETLSNGLYAKLIASAAITPEMFGAYGDGTHDDTAKIQYIIDNRQEGIVAKNSYNVSTITLKNREFCLIGRLIGQIKLSNNAHLFGGGTIQGKTTDACILIESTASGNAGYMNSTADDLNLVPLSGGVGIELRSDQNSLWGVKVSNIDISSCEKAIYITSSQYVTKNVFDNIFCHSAKYVIALKNNTSSVANLSDITFRDVYAQYYQGNPQYFMYVESGSCAVSVENSFCYDGIGQYQYHLADETDTRITFVGIVKNDFTINTFTDAASLRCFRFLPSYGTLSPYIHMTTSKVPPIDYYGNIMFENFTKSGPSLGRFYGLLSREGLSNGSSAPNNIYGISFYRGILAMLRSTDGTIASSEAVEVTTPYSGAVYESTALPTGRRNGATCWCSDLKMPLTYYNTHWYKPDGTQFS